MDFLEIFFQELREKGEQAVTAIKEFLIKKDSSLVTEIYRLFHTVKGSASLVGLVGYKELFHKIEEYFKNYTVGISELSDEFLSRLLSIIPSLLERENDLSEKEVQDILDKLEGKKEATSTIISQNFNLGSSENIQELLSVVLSIENSLMRGDLGSALRSVRVIKNRFITTIQDTYYVKLKNILSNFDILVIQEATSSKKKVKLSLEIGEEMIEKKDSQALIDILIHLVRNAVAHGIEEPEVRKKIGKAEEGRIVIRSYIMNNEIYLEVEDDGKGLDFEKIRKKASEKNLGHLRPEDVIFVPGFSTKDEADETSGRGIGLDAVKNFATARGGDVEFVTQIGKGTKFIIHFPVKSFLIRVLVVEADNQKFCISTSDIMEILAVPKVLNGKLKYKDRVCDIVYNSTQSRFGIVTKNYKAFLVDNIVGTFDGQISGEKYPSVKGFVKNIYIYPLPVIDIEAFQNYVTKKSEKKKILFVDDSFVTRNVVSKLLKTFDYDVIEAVNGIEALQALEKESINLILTDVEMPGMDGFELTLKIKQKYPELPVILFSTLSSEQLSKGLEVGADAYISKDEPPERLLRLIEKFLSRESIPN
ncbi:MAG: response regulator [Fervidobacterium sp.]